MHMKKSDEDKFNDRWVPEPNTGCWLWTGALDHDGYGRISIDGRHVGAHRISYRIFIGEIPDGMCVLHKCDTPPCVNPGHLFLGTHTDNRADCIRKGRGAVGEAQGLSKLTVEQVLQIRAARLREPQRITATRFGVSEMNVSYIQRRKTWKHI